MLDWPYPRLIAHRCGGALAPENTLAGLRVAAREGYRAVEFDVMLCGDGTPVLIHDETLERTTDGSGRVADATLADLARLDAGSWHGPAFAGEQIPTLEQAARLALDLGLWCNVEIKPSAGAEADTGRAVAALAAELWAGAEPAPLLSSFSETALEAARVVAPTLARGLLVESVPADWRQRLVRLGCRTLHARADRVDEALVRAAAASGHPVLTYTVNDPEIARLLLGAGVSALFTDRLDRLRSLA